MQPRTNNIHLVAASLVAALFVLAPYAAWADVPYWFDTGRTYEIYAYGSGDFLAAVFNGVAMITSGGFIHSLIKIALILVLLYGLMTTISGFIGQGGRKASGSDSSGGEGVVTIISVAITAFLAVGLFLSPRATVAIIDRVDPTQTQMVANVPFPSAFIPHMMSTVGDTIGREFETVFSLPNELQFRNGGIALGAKYTDALMNIYPPSSSSENVPSYAHLVTQSLREYYLKCVFPDFASLDGKAGGKTAMLDKMFTETDIMTYLKSPMFRDPNVIILAPNESGWATCAVAIDEIDSMWNEVYAGWRKDIELRLSGTSGLSGMSGVGNPVNLGSGALTAAVIDRYFKYSPENGQTTLKTIAALNLLRDSVDAYLAYYGAPSNTAYSISRRATTSGWLTGAKFFNTIVHTVRAVAEGIIYSISVLLPLFFVFGGFSVLASYGKIALWLQLWVPFYVIINLYADIEVQKVMDNIFITAVKKGPTLKTMDQIADQLELTLGYVGSLAPVIPALAWGLVSGGAYAMKAAVSVLGGGGTTATATSTGSQVMGMGNISMGNKSMASESYGASTTISSQASWRTGMVQGLSTVGAQNILGTEYGGAGGVIEKKGSTDAINQIGNIEGTAGKVDGAGGLSNFTDLSHAQGVADTKSVMSSAQAWATQKGGKWQDAIVDQRVAHNLFNAAKDSGASDFLKANGFDLMSNSVTAREYMGAYNALNMRNVGTLAKYNMDDPKSASKFYSASAGASGVPLPIDADNKDAVNASLQSLGLNTRVKENDVPTIFTDGTRIIGVKGHAGAAIERSDVTRAFTGNSRVTDNSTRNISGVSTVTDNSTKNLSGVSSLNDNSTRNLSGTSTDINNRTTVRGGYHEENLNLRNDRTASPEGLKNEYLDPKTGARVAGDVKGVVTSHTQTGDGSTQAVLSAATGDKLTSTSVLGDERTVKLDKLNVDAGVDARGMPSHMAREGAISLGASRDQAEAAIVGMQTGAQVVGGLASTYIKFRATTQALRDQFPSYNKIFGGGGTGTGGVAGDGGSQGPIGP